MSNRSPIVWSPVSMPGLPPWATCRPKLTAFMPRWRPPEPRSSCCACRSCVTVAVVLGALVLVDRWLKRMPAWSGTWRRFFALVIAAAAGTGDRLHRGTSAWRNGPAAANAANLDRRGRCRPCRPRPSCDHVFLASRPSELPARSAHMTALVRDLSIAIGWAIVGVTRRCDLASLEHRAGSRRPDANRPGQSRSTSCLQGWYGDTNARWPPPLPGRAREAAGGPALPNYGRQS